MGTFHFDKSYKISLSIGEDKETCIHQLQSNGDIRYTDGSKKLELAGTEIYKIRGGKGAIINVGM